MLENLCIISSVLVVTVFSGLVRDVFEKMARDDVMEATANAAASATNVKMATNFGLCPIWTDESFDDFYFLFLHWSRWETRGQSLIVR